MNKTQSLKRVLMRVEEEADILLRQNNKCKICDACSILVFVKDKDDLVCKPCNLEMRHLIPRLYSIKKIIAYLEQ